MPILIMKDTLQFLKLIDEIFRLGKVVTIFRFPGSNSEIKANSVWVLRTNKLRTPSESISTDGLNWISGNIHSGRVEKIRK